METLINDLTFALRVLRRNATFAASVVVTLAVGIGAATAMFGVVNGVLLTRLPIHDQGRVMVLRKEQLVGNETLVPFSVGDLRNFAAQARTLETVAGAQYDGAWPATMRDGDRVLSPNTAVVSGNFFTTLGMRATFGRTLMESDDVVGGDAIVISHALWLRAFGGDSTVVGRVIHGAGRGNAFRIVGVMPRGFAFPGKAEVWVPAVTVIPGAASNEGQWPYNLVGRMRAGVSAEQVRAELAAFLARKAYVPGEPRDVRASVRSIESLIVGDVKPALLALAGAVALLLGLANVNVANLFLVRGLGRRRELAVRAAIGAGGWRIARLMATEAVVLATLGGLAGLAVAAWLLRLVVSLAPAELPRTDAIRVDLAVAAATGVMVVVSALAFSLWPAIAVSRQRDLHNVLRSGARTGAADVGSRRARSFLVVAQVALAIVVLVGAGLLGRTLSVLQHLDMGFASDELSTVELSLPESITSSRPRLDAFYGAVTKRLATMPGMSSATVVLVPPFSGRNGWDAFFTAEGQTARDAAANPALDFQPVLPSYFSTMGIPIRRGRGIAATDREGTALVAVVSRSFAERAWPRQDPIGKRFKFGHADAPSPWTSVVGVVDDVRYRELTYPRPVVYVAWAQQTDKPPLSFVVARGAAGHALTARDVDRLVRELEPRVLVTSVATMRQRLTTSLARPRFDAMVLGVFAAVAFVLAAVGVYGVIAALVRQRTPEIGIRLALGAQPGEVRWMVMRSGLGLAGAGVVAGLAASLAATRVLGAELYGVHPADPLTMSAASLALLVAAALACGVPARAASRVDPLTALKAE
ncbi:MAG TPA: ABC transporter permease [Gemmatimonadaceae bacterium]